MSEYYPLVAGRILHYALRDAYGEGSLRVSFKRVARKPGVLRAEIEQEIQRGERAPESFSYTVKSDAKGVSTSAWGREFPLPLAMGKAWRRGEASFRVEDLDARKLVPAGDFKKCLELSFTIGAGDGGGGRRFYAPGVGLIYAVSSDESDPYEYVLKKIV